MAALGVSLVNAGSGGISNTLVDGNFIYNTCTGSPDCSAIYAFDMPGTSTNLRWTNNFVRDGNPIQGIGNSLGSGMYADDCVSNLTMSGNVITGKNGANTIFYHGGNNIKVQNNIVDVGANGSGAGTWQVSDGPGCSAGIMSGNTYQNNIVIGSNGGGGYYLIEGTPKNAPNISNNAYFSYSGAALLAAGDYRDTSPLTVNPQISGWNYNIASGSPVYNAPVNFPHIVGGWGPPGFVIPQLGTAPSPPH